MVKKGKSIFDSLWFNVVMVVVAVVVFGESFVERNYVFMILWAVLLYHFVRRVIGARK